MGRGDPDPGAPELTPLPFPEAHAPAYNSLVRLVAYGAFAAVDRIESALPVHPAKDPR